LSDTILSTGCFIHTRAYTFVRKQMVVVCWGAADTSTVEQTSALGQFAEEYVVGLQQVLRTETTTRPV